MDELRHFAVLRATVGPSSHRPQQLPRGLQKALHRRREAAVGHRQGLVPARHHIARQVRGAEACALNTLNQNNILREIVYSIVCIYIYVF